MRSWSCQLVTWTPACAYWHICRPQAPGSRALPSLAGRRTSADEIDRSRDHRAQNRARFSCTRADRKRVQHRRRDHRQHLRIRCRLDLAVLTSLAYARFEHSLELAQCAREPRAHVLVAQRFGNRRADQIAAARRIARWQVSRKRRVVEALQPFRERELRIERLRDALLRALGIAIQRLQIQRPLVAEGRIQAGPIHVRGVAELVQRRCGVTEAPERTHRLRERGVRIVSARAAARARSRVCRYRTGFLFMYHVANKYLDRYGFYTAQYRNTTDYRYRTRRH